MALFGHVVATILEKNADFDGAINLYEQLATLLPDGAIAVSLFQIRKIINLNVRQAKLATLKKKSILAGSTPNKKSPYKSKPTYSASDADILSAAIAKTPRRVLEKTSPSSRRTVSDNVAEAMAKQVALQQAVNSHRPVNESHVSNQTESEYFEQNDQRDYEEVSPSSPVNEEPPKLPQVAEIAPSRKQMTNALKSKVAFAINYQLLDILNNGSKDEVSLLPNSISMK
jgi:hypothetical protein